MLCFAGCNKTIKGYGFVQHSFHVYYNKFCVCVMREMGGMKLHSDPGNLDLNLNEGKA